MISAHEDGLRPPRWPLILATVAVAGLAAWPVHRLAPERDAAGGVAWLTHWLDGVGPRRGAAALTPGLTQVTAAAVDIDTSLAHQQAIGAGTGIVLDSDGLVLTNNHVVDGADRGDNAISVTDIGNGRSYSAVVLGRDRRHDIALLQLSGATGLETAPLGDSSRIAPGDRVVGIGNAGGKGGVPSRAPGTVTALDQTVIAADALDSRSERLTGLIEITAPLRPGDSGGPLVDSAGQVIGIDTAAAANNRADGRTGQGYAIPIDQALQIAQRFLGRG